MALLGLQVGSVLIIMTNLTQAVLIGSKGAKLFEIICGVIAIILSLIIFYEANKKYYPISDKGYQLNLITYEVFFFLGIFLTLQIINLIFQ